MTARGRALVVLCGLGVAVATLGCTSGSKSNAARDLAASSSPPSFDLTSGAVPWVDRPAPSPWVPPTEPTSAPEADAPTCLTSDLTVSTSGRNGATGHTFQYLSFQNTSTRTCSMSGYPSVVASEPGHPDVHATESTFFPDQAVGGNLQPGIPAGLTLVTERDCPARYADPNTYPSAVYHRVTIQWSGGETSIDTDVDVLCGLAVSRFGVAQPMPNSVPDPRAGLTAALELPASVEPGARLVYVVALTNPTDHDIALDPCPGYVESIGALEVKENYALNCDRISLIGAHATTRFAMELRVPASARSGTTATLAWELMAASAANAKATVTIAGG